MDETGGFFFPRFVWGGGGLEESIAIPPNDSRKGEQKDDDADIFMDRRRFIRRNLVGLGVTIGSGVTD